MPTTESGDNNSRYILFKEFHEFIGLGFLTITLLKQLTTLFSTVSLCDPPENVTARVDAQVSV